MLLQQVIRDCEDFLEMMAHSSDGGANITGQDGVEDRLMLADQDADGRRRGQGQDANPVKLDLFALDDCPHTVKTDAFSNRAMKEVILNDEIFRLLRRIDLVADRQFAPFHG